MNEALPPASSHVYRFSSSPSPHSRLHYICAPKKKISEASSAAAVRRTRVYYPNREVLANRFRSTTLENSGRYFLKCSYFAVSSTTTTWFYFEF